MLIERTIFPASHDKEVYMLRVEQHQRHLNPPSEFINLPMDGYALGTVGNPVILRNTYDPNQAWLPFVQAVFLNAPPREQYRHHGLEWACSDDEYETYRMRRDREHRSIYTRKQIREIIDRPIYLDNKDRMIYRWDEPCDHDQHLIPFIEYQQCTCPHEFRHASEMWDKEGEEPKVSEKDTRKPYALEVQGIGKGTLIAWLKQNISGRFYLDDRTTNTANRVVFERHADWMHAKLRFDGKSRFEEFE